MDEGERQDLLDHLKSGREALCAAVAGVDDHLAARKPGPGRWSILECVEHVVEAERLLFLRVAAASRTDAPLGDRQPDAWILERGLDRARPRESPEPVRPTGRFGSLDEALSTFESVRAETIRYVEGLHDDPRVWLTSHPLIPGPVTCREMVLLIAIHAARHARQIAEIRTVLALPER